jgi:hypothetical protein
MRYTTELTMRIMCIGWGRVGEQRSMMVKKMAVEGAGALE